SDVQVIYFRGIAFCNSGQAEKAAAAFEQLAARPEKVFRIAAREGLCRVYADLGQFDKAAQVVDEALAIDSNLAAELLLARARHLYFVQGNFAKTVEDCNRYLTLRPNGHAMAFCTRGIALGRLERRNEALAD